MKYTYNHTIYACYSAYVVGAVVNNLPALLFVTFNRDYGFSPIVLSTLIVMNFVVQMLVDYFGARYADRIGYRKIVMASQLFEAAGLIFMAILPRVMNPYAGLIASTVFYSIGSGMTEVIISPITEALPGEDKAKKLGLMHSFYCWGVVATVVLSTMFFRFFGTERWWILCLLWTILPIVNTFVFARVPICQLREGEAKASVGSLMRVKVIWCFLLLMICSGAAEQGIVQWASYFAETELQISKQAADLLGPCLFSITMGAARVVWAKISTCVPIRPALCVSAAICAAGYLTAAFSPLPVLSLFGVALCGVGVAMFWPGVLSFASETYPAGGTPMFGLLALAGDIGCFSGPLLVASAADLSGAAADTVKAGLPYAALFPLIILVCAFLMRRRTKK